MQRQGKYRKYGEEHLKGYEPKGYADNLEKYFGHGGSDYYCMDQFVKKILGENDADIIDVYEAMDMFLPGMFAYRSILKGGIPMEIPNLRDKAVREKFRKDTMCTDPKVAGDMLIPTFSKGTPSIQKSVYEAQKKEIEKGLENDTYFKQATTQGKIDKESE